MPILAVDFDAVWRLLSEYAQNSNCIFWHVAHMMGQFVLKLWKRVWDGINFHDIGRDMLVTGGVFLVDFFRTFATIPDPADRAEIRAIPILFLSGVTFLFMGGVIYLLTVNTDEYRRHDDES